MFRVLHCLVLLTGLLVIVLVYYSTDLVLKFRNETVIVHWVRWT